MNNFNMYKEDNRLSHLFRGRHPEGAIYMYLSSLSLILFYPVINHT